jgi:hypothetical protein
MSVLAAAGYFGPCNCAVKEIHSRNVVLIVYRDSATADARY